MSQLLRTSERATWRQCRQRWWWTFEEKLRSNVTTPALRFGDLTHQALAGYYVPGVRRGIHPSLTFKRLYEESQVDFNIRDEDQRWIDALDLGIAVLEHYVERWGDDRAIEIIAPEMPFKVPLEDLGGEPFWYVGRFDALAYLRDVHEFVILEHKTATTIETRHLPLDEQAGSYWAFAPQWIDHLVEQGVIKGKHRSLDLDFILYNFLRKAVPDQRRQDVQGRYLNKDGSVSKVQPPPYFERVKVYRSDDDRKRLIHRVRQEAWEMRMVREGKLPVYKNPSLGYPDRHCETCPFYEMCELHETGSDWRSIAETLYEEGDPYAEYRADLGLEED